MCVLHRSSVYKNKIYKKYIRSKSTIFIISNTSSEFKIKRGKIYETLVLHNLSLTHDVQRLTFKVVIAATDELTACQIRLLFRILSL